MSFNAKQRAVLESVRDRKWQVIDDQVRVWGTRNNGERLPVCPVCAAAIKVRPMPFFLDWCAAEQLAGLRLSLLEGILLSRAADNPTDPRRAELLALLGVTP